MQTEEMVQESGLDLPELLARVEYDRELLCEIFTLFTEEFPGLLQDLRTAVLANDLEQARIAAHTLKGMLASLSFGKASASAMRIERLAMQAMPEGIPEELARMERSVARAQENLASVCGEVVP